LIRPFPEKPVLTSLYTRFSTQLGDILERLERAGDLPAGIGRGNVAVEPPRDVTHGDLATNAAMVLAKAAGRAETTAGRRGAERPDR